MNIDWQNLEFEYTETPYVVRSSYKDGRWQEPYATRDKYMQIHVCAAVFQYGQEAFEGLKAFRGADGKVRVFRWRDNAERMNRSCEALYMPKVPDELFEKAVFLSLEKNIDYLPPYETGATLYFRPIIIGTSAKIGVGPATEYEFLMVATPIGRYFKSGFGTTPFILNRHVDRAAPNGTGPYKVGGNYASAFRATVPAHEAGCGCMFVDPKYHRYIDECGAANFFGVLHQKGKPTGDMSSYTYVTPRSRSILPSITNNSLMTLSRDLGIRVEQRRIEVRELSDFTECACCGTASVISPIGSVVDPDRNVTYRFPSKPGPVCTKLYNTLLDIQYGRSYDRYGWCVVI